MAELARREDFALGAARVSPSTRLVRGPAGEVSLEPRAMQVLVSLAEDRGAVVTREEIFARCWGAALVGDDSLNRAIADIRRAFRAVAASAVAIETVPRTGYRLVAPADDSGPATPERPPPFPPWPRRGVALGAAALFVGGLGWQTLQRRRSEVDDLVEDADMAMRAGLPEGAEQAVERLERAVALQPRAPAPWGRLALAHLALLDAVPPGQAPAAAAAVESAARRALALDPRQADALAALAMLPPYFGEWRAAEQRLRRVLELAPGHLPTLDELAFLLVAVGRARESAISRLAFAGRAPLHAQHQYRLIYAHWILGRIDDADRAADRALQLWPKHPGVWFARLWVLAFTRRAARARRHLEDAAGRPDLPAWMLLTLALSLTAIETGRSADRRAAVERLLGEVSESPSAVVNALLLMSGMGETDRAIEVAQAYFLEEGPVMASVRWRPGQVTVSDQRRRKTHMLFVPVTAPLRADPRFASLVERIGLGRYWREAGVTPDFRR